MRRKLALNWNLNIGIPQYIALNNVKLWPQMKVVQENAGELMKKAFMELVSIFVEHAG